MRTSCPICEHGFKRDKAFIAREFWLGSKGIDVEYQRCPRCGTAFTCPMLTAEELTAFFGRSSYVKPELELSSRAHSEPFFRGLLRRIEQEQPQKGRLLDVGCSYGTLMTLAQAQGWEVEGVDLVPESLKYAPAKELRVHHNTPRGCNFEEGSFDVVTCVDSFYYFTEPLQELTEIKRILQPGGLLIMRLVNRLSLLRFSQGLVGLPLIGSYFRLLRSRLLGDSIVVYDASNLVRALKVSGFEPVVYPSRSRAFKSANALTIAERIWHPLAVMLYTLSLRRVVLSSGMLVVARALPSGNLKREKS